MAPPKVVTTRPVVSSGKKPVDQPKSQAARDTNLVRGPTAATQVAATPPHTSTVPDRKVP
jgi:hypothetical protein